MGSIDIKMKKKTLFLYYSCVAQSIITCASPIFLISQIFISICTYKPDSMTYIGYYAQL